MDVTSRYDRVGIIIHRKLCKQIRFNDISKQNQHIEEKVTENKNNIHFKIHTKYFIQVERPNQIEEGKEIWGAIVCNIFNTKENFKKIKAIYIC